MGFFPHPWSIATEVNHQVPRVQHPSSSHRMFQMMGWKPPWDFGWDLGWDHYGGVGVSENRLNP